MKSLRSRPGALLLLALCLTASGVESCWTQPLQADDQEDWLTIANIGDIMCHDPQLAAAWDAQTQQYNFDGVFEPIAAELSSADLTIANLETTLPGERRLYSGYPEFGSPDALPAAAKRAGVDVLTLANNHSVDKGRRGILRTIDVVEELGFRRLGTYRSLDDWNQHRILWLEIKGLRLALLNYTYGTNGIRVPAGVVVNQIENGRQIAEDLELARGQSPDAIIVIFHYGTEYMRLPDAYQRRWTDFALQNGADIVLGGHPHVVQPYQITSITDRFGETRDRLIIYSTGNFVSNQQKRYTDGGIIFRFALQKGPVRARFRQISYTPVWVWRDRSGGRLSYRILPAAQYLNNDQSLRLDSAALQRLRLFHSDLSAHLTESRARAENYEAALSADASGADMYFNGLAQTGESGTGCFGPGRSCAGR
ncbi:MAG: CapA family protein [Leptospirales bacterium]|nr:CapA family protein [Leptospirales bacterium]